MRDEVPCEFPAEYDGPAILERLGKVLDPELDRADPRSEVLYARWSCAPAMPASRYGCPPAGVRRLCHQTATDWHRQHPALSAD